MVLKVIGIGEIKSSCSKTDVIFFGVEYVHGCTVNVLLI